MYFKLKNVILKVLKKMGLFRLFKFLNSSKIPVLCYHGVSINDEHLFMPGNFIQFEVFKKRIEAIESLGYKIISLDQALEMHKSKQIEKNSVVLTIDDAFIPIFDELIPFLVKKQIPITCYVTSYKSLHQVPIFRLVCQYFFWKTKRDTFNLEHEKLGSKKWSIAQDMWKFISEVEEKFTREERELLLAEISKELEVQYTNDIRKTFSIASHDLLDKFKSKIDIQLHTHYHNMELPLQRLEEDMLLNREYLKDLNEKKQIHFCYPSGVWNSKHFDLLEKNGVVTATTCDSGLMGIDTHLYKIPRIIDSNKMSQIVFESELCGFNSFLRKLINK